MRRGIVWLCSDASNGTTGRRYIARLWPQGDMPLSEAAQAAAVPSMLFPAAAG